LLLCHRRRGGASSRDDPVAGPSTSAPIGLRARRTLSLLVSTLVEAGMWAAIVVLPRAQLQFSVDRSAASDRDGIALRMAISGLSLGLDFVVAGLLVDLGHDADRRRRPQRGALT
jgi:hypothetical protein